MAQVTIYLPDDLRDRAKAAGLNISGITRESIGRELGRRAVFNQWADGTRLASDHLSEVGAS